MGLSERLGPVRQAANSSCGVCRWYAELDDTDKADFTDWLASGGGVQTLWRACCADTDSDGQPVKNPLTLKRPRFAECVDTHFLVGELAQRRAAALGVAS